MQESDDDLDLPIAERRKQREIRLPARFQDGLPEIFHPLPPENIDTPLNLHPQGPSQPQTDTGGIPSASKVRESGRNGYGLFRRYFTNAFPSHDPDSDLTGDDLCDIPNTPHMEPSNMPNHNYGPYPNRSSFLLGEWNWNNQVQKSKSTFRSLIDIITDSNFCAADVCDTRWETIDKELGSSEITEDSEEEPIWLKDDARWMNTPISISVPFHRYTPNPGPREYIIPQFYHRSIISVLREALSHPLEGLRFHHEPYELYWKLNDQANPIRVFGELYTSPVFIEAHQALQDLPPEPGCTLPRFIAGLMLASDATHVTSFGDTKIWPQYLFFGNHSKYRRCKPNCHLCYHIAYFQKVSFLCPLFGTFI